MYDWSDVKFFLATVRGGSTLAAARELGVNQTTVARRISALEAAMSVRLFDHTRRGFRLSEAGSAILSQAERVADEAETLERLCIQRSRNLSGVVRVTTTESIANTLLAPLLAEFMELHPHISIEVIAAAQRLDLARGEADVAIRAGPMPTAAGITVRKLADDLWALFCSRAYADKYGAPKSPKDLDRHIIIGSQGFLTKLDPFKWLAEAAPNAKVRSACNTIANAVAAIGAGHGVGPPALCRESIRRSRLNRMLCVASLRTRLLSPHASRHEGPPAHQGVHEIYRFEGTSVKAGAGGLLHLRSSKVASIFHPLRTFSGARRVPRVVDPRPKA